MYQRKQLRIKGYDYSQAGQYFVTICARNRINLFGEIVVADDPVRTNLMQPNEIGEIVCECWNKINVCYDHIKTDVFCLMPNHIHGIIIINGEGGLGRPPLQKII